MRPHLFAAAAAQETCAVATITASTGGPRPVGAQMLVTEGNAWGYLSGGCIEADVALHARTTIADGLARHLVYGQGSPFLDLRLPCGGRLEVTIERVASGDDRVSALKTAWRERTPAIWTIEGGGEILFQPPPRLIVVGGDPFAVAIAMAGAALGWEVVLNIPFGPATMPISPFTYARESTRSLLEVMKPDAWTAIAIATHDIDGDHDALVPALQSAAGYVGALGARRRLPERLEYLRAAGISHDALKRLHAPIGLTIAATTPRETAIAAIAEIIGVFREGTAARR